MELHNTVEETVISRVNEIFDDIKANNPGKLCICEQCRTDTVCYALNRTPPHYIVSNRGVARVHQETIERQQHVADVTTLIYEGLKKVSHNQRPYFSHSVGGGALNPNQGKPAYVIPTIIGRLFNGSNFAPLSGADVELLRNGEIVPMKDGNWQNPCRIVPNTEGTFSFWPVPEPAQKVDEHAIFEYSLRVSSPDFETLVHYFRVPVASEIQAAGSFTLERTFKLPDLYMFSPGESEQSRYID